MADADGGEGAGAGGAVPFLSRAFIPRRELPGNFPDWSRGTVPRWPLPTGGCVTLKEQGRERRAAAPGAEAPSGLGAREAGHCIVPRIAQGLLGPHSLKRAEAFLRGFSVSFQGVVC